MVIISAFQAEDDGSIPFTRSKIVCSLYPDVDVFYRLCRECHLSISSVAKAKRERCSILSDDRAHGSTY